MEISKYADIFVDLNTHSGLKSVLLRELKNWDSVLTFNRPNLGKHSPILSQLQRVTLPTYCDAIVP